MEMHSVANLATLQTSLPLFSPLFKNVARDKSLGFAQTVFSFWDSLVLAFPARAHLSLSLSVRLLCSASGGEEQRFQLKQILCCFSNCTCKYSIAEITARLLSLSHVYLISSDDGSIIRIFVQINILEGRAGYVA